MVFVARANGALTVSRVSFPLQVFQSAAVRYPGLRFEAWLMVMFGEVPPELDRGDPADTELTLLEKTDQSDAVRYPPASQDAWGMEISGVVPPELINGGEAVTLVIVPLPLPVPKGPTVVPLICA